MEEKNKQAKRVNIIGIKMVKEASIMYKPRSVSSPQDAVDIVRQFLEDEDREKVIAVYLNTKNEPTAIHTISVGSLNSSIVHPREVMKGAILSNANSLIIAHNHPSSLEEAPYPSNEDIKITQRIKDAGNILGINLTDHIIIGGRNFYYSFKEGNLL